MPRLRYGNDAPYSFGRPWTPAVRALILTQAAVFLLQTLWPVAPWPLLGLQMPELFSSGRWWQPFTYLFLHAGFWHLAFNAFTLWMFGTEVELALGSRRFLAYYLVTGVGAGLCVAGLAAATGERSVTIGSSGAIFGVLLAYGWLFANHVITLLVFFILPVQMKAWTMVLIFAALEFFAGVGHAVGRVSHVAHLGGMGVGAVLFLLGWPRRVPGPRWWETLRLRRRHPQVRIISRQDDPEAEVDELLAKITEHGLGSLSPRERELLAEAARRRRDHTPQNN